jgi:hypothetical protein
VGFSGHRRLADPDGAGRAIGRALEHLAIACGPLTGVASAACGADTLFLEQLAARSLPWRLILPFGRERFQKDFTPAEWERVSPLIARAASVEELPEAEPAEIGYLKAGYLTVERAEVMIVVWDGKPAAGPGGTGDTVAYARKLKRPLIIIDPATGNIQEERLDQLRPGSRRATASPRAMKRILALDGGGIRGVFTLQILAAIEQIFRREHGRDQLVLAEVFDLIAGTSTGAIIATFLSWGLPVREIERLYIESGPSMFARSSWTQQWKSKYQPDAIAGFFQKQFAENDGTPALLGTAKLRTLLLIVMRNGSTGSAWPVSNNPKARYNDRARPDCNLLFPLWQLLRASTAAPTFFPPEEIRIGAETHLFMDGGMTPYNNPTLIAILMATLPAYQLGWPANRRDLHVVSVGTGLARARMDGKAAADVNILDHIKHLAPSLIGAIAWEQDFLCRVLGNCVHGASLDSEIGVLAAPGLLNEHEQKFTYARYDTPLDATHPRVSQLPRRQIELDNIRHVPILQELGAAYAAAQVRKEHLFPPASL